MKLWLLRPIHTPGDDPWEPWYDKTFGFVVRADDAQSARQFAHEDAGNENWVAWMGRRCAKTDAPWLDPAYSTCTPLTDDGEPGVVIHDHASA